LAEKPTVDPLFVHRLQRSEWQRLELQALQLTRADLVLQALAGARGTGKSMFTDPKSRSSLNNRESLPGPEPGGIQATAEEVAEHNRRIREMALDREHHGARSLGRMLVVSSRRLRWPSLLGLASAHESGSECFSHLSYFIVNAGEDRFTLSSRLILRLTPQRQSLAPATLVDGTHAAGVSAQFTTTPEHWLNAYAPGLIAVQPSNRNTPFGSAAVGAVVGTDIAEQQSTTSSPTGGVVGGG
jgi:hypothetical protein